jgi:hypothetical protein
MSYLSIYKPQKRKTTKKRALFARFPRDPPALMPLEHGAGAGGGGRSSHAPRKGRMGEERVTDYFNSTIFFTCVNVWETAPSSLTDSATMR